MKEICDRKVHLSLFEGKDQENVVHVCEEKQILFRDLPNYIQKQSYSHIRFKNRYRRQKNFERAGFVAIDVDEKLPLKDAIIRIKKANLRAIVATTRNHQKVKIKKSGKRVPACDRYRILVCLSEDVTSEPDHRATVQQVRELFPESDSSPVDGARYFFPSPDIVLNYLTGAPFQPVKGQVGKKECKSPRLESLPLRENSNSPKVILGVDASRARSRALDYLRTREPAIEGQGGDAHTLQTAMRIMDYGVNNPEECCEILENSGWNGRCVPPWDRGELLQKCKNAFRSRQSPIGSDSPEAVFGKGESAAVSKPTITIKRNCLHNLVSDSEKALISANSGLYARGAHLVEPVTEEVDASRGRKTLVTRLKEATPCLIRLRLSEAANWQKWDSRTHKMVPADPPKDVAESILHNDGRWSFQRLAGVITCPTLRPDGSILVTPGYDKQTRLLLVSPPKMPEFPRKPSRADAMKSLTNLSELLTEFPYVNQESRSVALSMLITPVVRGALSSAPLHAVRATSAGSGKSFSTDIPSCMISGYPCPVVAAGRNEEETEKRLGAVLRTGQPIVNIDNVNGELGGDALCQLIERPIVQIRILGRSEMIRIESKATVYATGNGIVLTGDMTRRVVLCSLDANLERPELREFKGNPVERVLENRGFYIAAALTIVRAYIEAGLPGELSPLGSFADWSRLVRSALVWLGEADPVKTMEAARAEDPQTVHFELVVSAWAAAYGLEVSMTASELVKKLNGSESPLEELAVALRTVAPDRSANGIDVTRLGKWLSKHNGKVALGLKLVGSRDSHAETNKWSLIDAPQCPGRQVTHSEKCHFDKKHLTVEKVPGKVGTKKQLGERSGHGS